MGVVELVWALADPLRAIELRQGSERTRSAVRILRTVARQLRYNFSGIVAWADVGALLLQGSSLIRGQSLEVLWATPCRVQVERSLSLEYDTPPAKTRHWLAK